MRSKIICLLALILAGAIACQKGEEKIEVAALEEKVDMAAEEEAIKAALIKEMDTFKNFDYEGIASVWSHEPYIYHNSFGIVGWDSLSIQYKTIIREVQEKGPEYATIRELSASNFDIHLNGNVAFVLYDEQSDYTWEGEESSGVHKVMKYFEKKEGEWKLVAVLPGR